MVFSSCGAGAYDSSIELTACATHALVVAPYPWLIPVLDEAEQQAPTLMAASVRCMRSTQPDMQS